MRETRRTPPERQSLSRGLGCGLAEGGRLRQWRGFVRRLACGFAAQTAPERHLGRRKPEL